LSAEGFATAAHGLWSGWTLDPLVVVGITLAGTAYYTGRQRGRRRQRDAWRGRCFAAGLVAVAVALLSPLDQVSNALASTHIVQHLLLVLVAALLAASTPSTALVRGTPAIVRRTVARWRVRTRLTRRNTGLLRHPGAVWLLHVGSLWFWHESVPYDLALEHDVVHALEHATFLLTAVLFWGLVVEAYRPGGMSPGFVVVLLFATAHA
jgi:putative membrane protein